MTLELSDLTPRERIVFDALIATDVGTYHGQAQDLRSRARETVSALDATSPAPEGGDLAEAIRREAEKLDPRHDHYSREGAATVVDRVRIELYRIASRVGAPAPWVATPPQEGGTVGPTVDDVAAELARVSGSDFAPSVGQWVHVVAAVWDAIERLRPAPAAPPAEGEAVQGVGMLHAALGDLDAIFDHLAREEGVTKQDLKAIARRARRGRERIAVALRDAPDPDAEVAAALAEKIVSVEVHPSTLLEVAAEAIRAVRAGGA